MGKNRNVDLSALAYHAMLEVGFQPDFSNEAHRQVSAAQRDRQAPAPSAEVRDLRSLLWSSIDNDDSRDLDQLEYASEGADGVARVLVAIADVDELVPKGSPIDLRAERNTTSVYTGVRTFPMLPEEFSTDLTSLNPDQDRLAVVVEVQVDDKGVVCCGEVYRALVRNHAQLAYEELGAWIDGSGPAPTAFARVAGLAEQIRLQDAIAERLRGERERRGALEFETIEARPVMKDGQVVSLDVPHKTRARWIIENFMIAANSAMAIFLETKGLAIIQRVVRTPARWPRIVQLAAQYGDKLPMDPDPHALSAFLDKHKKSDPDHFPDLSLSVVKLLGRGEYVMVRSMDEALGHFGLAEKYYTHSTAPNRRFIDLVTQRILKAVAAGRPTPYTDAELVSIAARCTERENAANKVERHMRKSAAAVLLGNRIGDIMDAIVTGASPKGTYVRTLAPHAEGRLMQGERGADVGDKIHVRLLHTNVERGFIDFARVQ